MSANCCDFACALPTNVGPGYCKIPWFFLVGNDGIQSANNKEVLTHA
jgi:hypothetical protein